MLWFKRVAGSSFRVVSVSCQLSVGKRSRSPILALLLRPAYLALRHPIDFRESRKLAEKKLKPPLKHRSISGLSWMGARAVDWARLESVCTARYRGFESLPIRKSLVPVAGGFGWGACFDLLYEPGGHWRWRGRTAKSNGEINRRLLTTFAGCRRVPGENSRERREENQTAAPVLAKR
jgi:hypothetical protein